MPSTSHESALQETAGPFRHSKVAPSGEGGVPVSSPEETIIAGGGAPMPFVASLSDRPTGWRQEEGGLRLPPGLCPEAVLQVRAAFLDESAKHHEAQEQLEPASEEGRGGEPETAATPVVAVVNEVGVVQNLTAAC